jgi:hypothetical protein
VTRAPDLIEPVVAFRTWRVVDSELASPYLGLRWGAGVVEAQCAERGDGAPHPGCRCGIHAYLEPRSALPEVDHRRVTGLVAGWGRLEVHPGGVRAQFARVQALGSCAGWSSWHRAAVVGIADRLGVPLLDERALAAAASDYGSPLPVALAGV